MSQNKVQHFADNIINCCSNQDHEDSQDKNLLENTISELEEENSLKSQHIEKLKKNQSTLLQDAIETENALRETINYKELEIKNLRTELENLSKAIPYKQAKEIMTVSTQTQSVLKKSVYTQIYENSEQISKDNQLMSYPSNSHERQSETIEYQADNVEDQRISHTQNNITLLNESTSYLEITSDEQFLTLHQETSINKLTNDPTTITLDESSQDIGKNANSREILNIDRRGKILIIGDEYAKNFATILDLVMDMSNYSVEEIIKPKCELSDITLKLFEMLTNYGANDHVIVLFNTKNISNNVTLRHALRNLLPVGKFTNLIIISELNQNNDKIIVNAFKNGVHKFKKVNINSSVQFHNANRYYGSRFIIVKKIDHFIKRTSPDRIVLKTVNIVKSIDSDNFFRSSRM